MASADRPLGTARPRSAVAGAVLLLLGILLLALWRVVGHGEKQPWVSGATPPSSVHVTAGKQYRLAVHGGVSTVLARGVVSRADRFGGLFRRSPASGRAVAARPNRSA